MFFPKLNQKMDYIVYLLTIAAGTNQVRIEPSNIDPAIITMPECVLLVTSLNQPTR